MPTDSLLTRYLESRSSADFEAIVDAHGAMVFGTALRSTSNRVLAEEVTQEVFIMLVRKADAIREPHKLAAWLHRATMFSAANINRKESSRRRAMNAYQEESLAERAFASKEDEIAWQQVVPLLDEAIDALPVADREAVMLRFYEKSAFKDIARLTNRSEAACRKRVARALNRLAALLRKRGAVASPSVLGIGLGVCFTQDTLPLTSKHVTQIALTAAPSAPASTFTSILLAMSAYKFTLLTAAVAALVPVGWQWYANHTFAYKDRTFTPHEETVIVETRHFTEETPPSAPRSSAEILAQLQEFTAFRNPYHTGVKARELMFSLRPDEMQAAFEAVKAFASTSSQGAHVAITALFTRWASIDPPTAKEHALSLSKPRLRGGARSGLVQGWLENDPASLEAFIESFPEGSDKTQLEASHWVFQTYKDPIATADKALAIEDPDKQTETLNRVLVYWWNDPRAAIDWLDKVEDSVAKDAWIDNLLAGLAQRNPGEAFEESMRLLEGEPRKSNLRRIMEHWSAADPETAFTSLIELPEDTRDAHIIESYARGLGAHLHLAGTYVEALADESERHAFVRGLTAGLSYEYNRDALDTLTIDQVTQVRPFVESLPPGDDRFASQWNFATAWASLDFASARDWYNAQPGVQDRMKEKFVKLHTQ